MIFPICLVCDEPVDTSEITSQILTEIEEGEEFTTEDLSADICNRMEEHKGQAYEYNNSHVYVLITLEQSHEEELQTIYIPEGPKLTPSAGVFEGPSGHETYYNLNMNGVVSIMRSLGYSEEEYPYWVREDGVKMLGPYVMVAANLSTRPRGTILPTSLGDAIVCDTGGFVSWCPNGLDIATSW